MYSWNNESFEFEGLVGKTLTKIDDSRGDELVFYDTEGEIYVMYHQQDCCESVYIEDINGDLEDLLHSPILMAEESTSHDDLDDEEEEDDDWDDYGTHTWTFYKIATIKGTVTIRWLGTSNGYYSESVSLVHVTDAEDKRSYQENN
ncbi:hypothetical protein KAMFAM_143 [Bacillus phage Kamfam]|nr:hypothetical protein OTK52_141 [Bacillus phage OTooleKemple52]AXQ67231.1 hypothetical protein KAMFAM_143 [Bacillus phage Kamfam]